MVPGMLGFDAAQYRTECRQFKQRAYQASAFDEKRSRILANQT
jgi:hypothetical protein